MNFAEVEAQVIAITQRPDKVIDIRREINAALLFCATDNVDFADDLVETDTAITATVYSQTIPLATFPRFRKFYYIRIGTGETFLDPITPKNIFKCGQSRNAYYLTGTNVNVRMSALSATLGIGYFAYPPILLLGTDTYWMLDKNPYMIINRVAAKIFADTGDDASSTKQEGYFRLAWLAFRDDQGIERT